MDSIKKKMQSLANETANASARAERWEREVKRINETADQYEEQVRQLQKKIQERTGLTLLVHTERFCNIDVLWKTLKDLLDIVLEKVWTVH